MSRTSKSLRRLVIKIGSNVLSSETGLRKNFFSELARQVRFLQDKNVATVIVTSGAVATAMAHFGKKRKPDSIPEKQAYAAFGQPMLMHQYALAFGKQDLAIAQILLTQADLENRKRFLNAKQAINTLLSKKIIPIINENDTVAVDELKVGDNDQLSAHVANLVNADLLLILSDVAGLFDKDPSRFKDAKVIPVVEAIDDKIEAMIFKTREGKSTGGMATKIKAAKLCADYGLPLRITSGFQKDIAIKLLNQKLEGTLFTAKVDALTARKHWIANIVKPKGTIYVDEGASGALKSNKSLLPSGIRSVTGEFEIGDCLAVYDLQENLIAKGLAGYSKTELDTIKGQKSRAITDLLGYRYGDEAIHKDDLVVL